MQGAGQQTTKLIEEAVRQSIAATNAARAMYKSAEAATKATEHMSKSADAATKGADAATKSANALVHSERAWIEPRFVKDIADNYGFEVTNYGRTLAIITGFKFGVVALDLNEPKPERLGEFLEFTRQNVLVLPNSPVTLDHFGIADYFADQWIDIVAGVKNGLVFGSVEYLDVVGSTHQSIFAYEYGHINHLLTDLRRYRKYT
ncbi:MAG TPA: hypothetical protein VNX88_04795 [Terriglobales bacterium]|jgi:hypothetical protein|nr:hypothetical protein [Terriglobales bacterium]